MIRGPRGQTDVVYAIVLGWPGAGETITLGAFDKDVALRRTEITHVSLLGHPGDVAFARTRDGVVLTCPDATVNDIALAFKLVTQRLPE